MKIKASIPVIVLSSIVLFYVYIIPQIETKVKFIFKKVKKNE